VGPKKGTPGEVAPVANAVGTAGAIPLVTDREEVELTGACGSFPFVRDSDRAGEPGTGPDAQTVVVGNAHERRRAVRRRVMSFESRIIS
jgi:hypothetical protein